jgi:hypothetical protein
MTEIPKGLMRKSAELWMDGGTRRATIEPFRDTYVVECWDGKGRLHCLPARGWRKAFSIARLWVEAGEIPEVRG